MVGSCLVPVLAARHQLRTLDRVDDPASPEHIVGSLLEEEPLRRAMDSVEVLVHLAAYPDEGPFEEELVPSNVVGLQRTFAAAKDAGVRRIVFASTCQAVLQHPRGRTVTLADGFAPISLYGTTKAFGEVLGRYHHDHHGIEFLAVRIGAFLDYHDRRFPRYGKHPVFRELWLGREDCQDLFVRAVEHPHIGCEAIFATSKTDLHRLDPEPARRLLGYEPRLSVSEVWGELEENPNDVGAGP